VQRRSAPLTLESLESRDCPSAPVINSFHATEVSAQTWTFSGTVSDQNLSMVQVQFGGLAGLSGMSASVNSGGNFSTTVTLAPGVGGYATAQAIDHSDNLSSGSASALADVAPTVTISSITYGASKEVTVAGQVVSTGGASVNFSGDASGSTTVYGNGAFSVELQSGGAGNIQAIATDSWGLVSSAAALSVAPTNPSVTLMSITYGADKMVTVMGQTSSSQPGPISVNFTGDASGSITASNGSFSAQLQTSGPGNIQATATDSWGLVSSAAAIAVAPISPSVTLTSITYGANMMVTVTGQAFSSQPGTIALDFGGVTSGSVTANSDGTFSVQLETSGLGVITATAADSWGLESSAAEIAVAPAAPQITGLTAVQETNDYWAITGTVVAPNIANLLVTFSGFAPINGTQVSVAANGTFQIVVQLQPGAGGNIDAETTDAWGQLSNIACVSLDA